MLNCLNNLNLIIFIYYNLIFNVYWNVLYEIEINVFFKIFKFSFLMINFLVLKVQLYINF